MAVKLNGIALKHIHNQTEEMCMLAVNQTHLALEYVHNQTEAMVFVVVQARRPPPASYSCE